MFSADISGLTGVGVLAGIFSGSATGDAEVSFLSIAHISFVPVPRSEMKTGEDSGASLTGAERAVGATGRAAATAGMTGFTAGKLVAAS